MDCVSVQLDWSKLMACVAVVWLVLFIAQRSKPVKNVSLVACHAQMPPLVTPVYPIMSLTSLSDIVLPLAVPIKH